MRMKKVLVLAVSVLCLSSSVLASAIKDKLLEVGYVVQAEQVEFSLRHEPLITQSDSFSIAIKYTNDFNIGSIEIFDYGGIIDTQVNSNKLACRASNVLVVKFAKVQNKNNERMQLAS